MIETDARTVKSVETACKIIETLREQNGATVSDIAHHLEKSAGTVHTHLATLKQFGYVVQEGNRYELGPEFLPMGEYVRHHSALYKAAKPQIDELAAATGESAHLIVEHHGRLYALYERFGSNAVGVEYHNRKRENPLRHLHCTAAGKAILAHVPQEKFITIIDRNGLPPMTESTITKIDELVEELGEIRDRGVAFVDQEQIDGLRAVGAPVHDPNEKVVGAIAVSGPVSRLKNDRFREEFPENVLDAASVTEFNMHTEQADQLQ